MSQADTNMGASASASNIIRFPLTTAPRARSADSIQAELEAIHARYGYDAALAAVTEVFRGAMAFLETYEGEQAYRAMGAQFLQIGEGCSTPIEH